jgi:hypothetical protein
LARRRIEFGEAFLEINASKNIARGIIEFGEEFLEVNANLKRRLFVSSLSLSPTCQSNQPTLAASKR